MAILSCHVSIKLPPKISDGQKFFIDITVGWLSDFGTCSQVDPVYV